MALSHALLGFLNYKPMTGYDLKKILNDSINFFWQAQTSQIYRELKILEKEGYIVSTEKPSQKGPNRHEYSITERGVCHLREWLAEANTDEVIRNDFMVWLLFSSNVDKDELYTQLQSKLQDYKKEYNMLEQVDDKLHEYADMFGKENEKFYWKIVLNRGMYDVKAKISWAEDTLNKLKDKT